MLSSDSGVYTVTVKARDEAGNEGEDVIQITVEEPQDPEEPKEPEAPKGCKGCKDAAAPARWLSWTHGTGLLPDQKRENNLEKRLMNSQLISLLLQKGGVCDKI